MVVGPQYSKVGVASFVAAMTSPPAVSGVRRDLALQQQRAMGMPAGSTALHAIGARSSGTAATYSAGAGTSPHRADHASRRSLRARPLPPDVPPGRLPPAVVAFKAEPSSLEMPMRVVAPQATEPLTQIRQRPPQTLVRRCEQCGSKRDVRKELYAWHDGPRRQLTHNQCQQGNSGKSGEIDSRGLPTAGRNGGPHRGRKKRRSRRVRSVRSIVPSGGGTTCRRNVRATTPPPPRRRGGNRWIRR